jgi:hypothetical protein
MELQGAFRTKQKHPRLYTVTVELIANELSPPCFGTYLHPPNDVAIWSLLGYRKRPYDAAHGEMSLPKRMLCPRSTGQCWVLNYCVPNEYMDTAGVAARVATK